MRGVPASRTCAVQKIAVRNIASLLMPNRRDDVDVRSRATLERNAVEIERVDLAGKLLLRNLHEAMKSSMKANKDKRQRLTLSPLERQTRAYIGKLFRDDELSLRKAMDAAERALSTNAAMSRRPRAITINES